MATKAGVGMSRHHNPNVAGRVAAEQALEKAGVSKPDFVFYDGLEHGVLGALVPEDDIATGFPRQGAHLSLGGW